MIVMLIVVLLLSGAVFTLSVLLMSPKGGLGLGLWGASGVNEYGSKKSVEWTLKKSALISSIIFIVCVLILPYMQ